MDDFQAHVKAVWRFSLFFLSICLVGWLFAGAYQSFFAGLLLGSAISAVNSQYLAFKIGQAATSVIQKTNRRVNLGFVTRASLALLAIIVAAKYEQHISIAATIIGLFLAQLATLLLGIVSLIGKNK
jgi:ATP synthase protein I